jgi:hypothetical protein
MFEFESRFMFYDPPHHNDTLENDCRLLAPTSPLHPIFDDVRIDWLSDWQVA